MAAVNCVLLTKVVVRSAPFQRTFAVETKDAPFTVSVKPALPASALEGEIVLIVGEGLLIVNVCAPDVPPPGVGLKTVTFTVPPVATSLAGIAAVNCVLLTKVVVRSAPFQRTFELEMNEEPFTVSVNPGSPALALVGEMEVKTGTGF
jgi:hypothetical protein